MGGNVGLRLGRAGHRCVVFDQSAAAVRHAAAGGAEASSGLADLVRRLRPPRAVWVTLPAGATTERTVAELGTLLERGDTVIDGGNTFFKDDVRRAREPAPRGVAYVDVGTSGGVWGLERGCCLMIGGDKATVDRLDPIFAALSCAGGGSWSPVLPRRCPAPLRPAMPAS